MEPLVVSDGPNCLPGNLSANHNAVVLHLITDEVIEEIGPRLVIELLAE